MKPNHPIHCIVCGAEIKRDYTIHKCKDLLLFCCSRKCLNDYFGGALG